MDILYHSFLSSKPFLVIAPNGTEFHVHGALVAQHSPVLAVDVNGSMKEAETRTIKIEDIDGDRDDDTVMRFIEFAYRGDYTVPSPTKTPSASKEHESKTVGWNVDANHYVSEQIRTHVSYREVETEDFRQHEEIFVPSSKKDKKRKSKRFSDNRWVENQNNDEFTTTVNVTSRDVLWSKFCDRAFVKQTIAWEPSKNTEPSEDCTHVLLCHARLYVFSKRYECDALRDLSLQKLRLTLSRLQLHPCRRPDITELVRYTYIHTPDIAKGSDKLRNLVSDYVFCHFEQICEQKDFLAMLQERDGLAKDWVTKVMARLQ